MSGRSPLDRERYNRLKFILDGIEIQLAYSMKHGGCPHPTHGGITSHPIDAMQSVVKELKLRLEEMDHPAPEPLLYPSRP